MSSKRILKRVFLGFVAASFALSPLASLAKKKEPKKEEAIHFKDLSPKKKLLYLSQLIFTGQIPEALSHLAEIGDVKGDAQFQNRLSFMQAYLLLLGGKPKEAGVIFESLNGKYPEVAPVLPYWQAKSERLGGDPKKAVATLEKFCGGPCTQPDRVVKEYANALCESGNASQASEIFSNLLNPGSKTRDQEITRLSWIECRAKSGEAAQAYDDLRSVYTRAPAGIPKEQLNSLLSLLHGKLASLPGQFNESDRMQRVSALKGQDRWTEAAQELKELLSGLSDASQSPLRADSAETFFKARFYREAAEQYEKLLKERPDLPDRTETLEKLASSYARSNQFDKAIKAQNELESLSPDGSAKRSYKISFLLADAGRCDEAIRAFQDFLDRFPKSNKRDDALWQKAWCAYQTKKYDSALQSLNQLEVEFPRGNYSQRAAYWKYRILEAAGKSGDAREARQNFIDKSGENFYRRWENQYRGGGKGQCPRSEGNILLSKGESFSPASLLGGGRSSQETASLKELLSLGMWEDFLALYQNSNLERGLTPGDSSEAVREWIPFIAASEQVPPELVWAVMREESHFNSKALSPVGAMGLMQIMPQTGYEISDSLKLSNFASDDLYKPLINVRFGVHYLSQLLKKFSGNLVDTIAAYNAGPEAVERWQGQRPQNPCDEFIEEIPYRETHNYVKKVMKSLWDYRDNPPSSAQAVTEK